MPQVVSVSSTGELRAAACDPVDAERPAGLVRRPDHGRRRRRLPAGHAPRTQAGTGRLARTRAGADAGPPRRGCTDRQGRGTAAGPRRAAPRTAARPRRVRRRDRRARTCRRQAAPQGRRPAGRQRRRRGRLRLRDRHQPGHAARGGRDERGTAAPRKRDVAHHILDRVGRALDDRDAAAQTGSRSEPSGSRPDERTNVEPAPDRRRHRQAACRRPALRDVDRVRLPDREAARRGGHPGHARRRLARHRPARLRQRDPRDDGRHAPPHGGGGAGHEPGARGRRHAVPVVLDPDRSGRERRPLPPRGRCPGGQDRGRGPRAPASSRRSSGPASR